MALTTSSKLSINKIYDSEIDSLPHALHNVSGVLYCTVIAVDIFMHGANEKNASLFSPLAPHAYNYATSEGASSKILLANGTLQSMTSHVSSTVVTDQSNTVMIDSNDVLQQQHIRSEIISMRTNAVAKIVADANTARDSDDNLVHASEEGLQYFQMTAMIQRQITRLLQHFNNDGMPLEAILNKIERCILSTEVLSFTSLAEEEMFRYDRLQQFNSMINNCIKNPPAFTKYKSGNNKNKNDNTVNDDESILLRKYFRSLSPFLFSQILSSEATKHPLTLRKYHSSSDSLLYALAWKPPLRRISSIRWTSLQPSLLDKPIDYNEVVNSKELVEDTITLTPAGNCIVTVKYSHCSDNAWMSLYVDNACIGLRINRFTTSKASSSSDHRGKAPVASAKHADSKNEDMKEMESEPGLESVQIDASTTSNNNESINNLELEAEVLHAPKLKLNAATVAPTPAQASVGSFFCYTEDDVRILSFVTSEANGKKPDGYGSIGLSVIMPSDLSVTVSSNGIISIKNSYSRMISVESACMGVEIKRYVLQGGIITRHFADGVYSKEIMYPNGTRYLFKSNSDNDSEDDVKATRFSAKDKFHQMILSEAPDDLDYVVLGVDGLIQYCTTSSKMMDVSQVLMNKLSVARRIDAETLADISHFPDNRLVILHADGLKEVVFGDGTSILHHPSGDLIVIKQKEGVPTIEVDVKADKMCSDHAKGMQVPLSKGGELVRARISMPDGSACFIKYDTRVTSSVNGIIKLVRKDRSVITVTDDGTTVYSPRNAWSNESEAAFRNECKDTSPPLVALSESSLLPSHSTTSVASVTFASDLQRHRHNTVSIESINLQEASKVTSQPSVLNTVKVNDRASVVSDVTSASALKETSKYPVLDTKYQINIIDYTCHIEDYEYNCFDIDLLDPLHPKIELSGEVAGLIPQAVCPPPLSHRLFVVERSGAAVEIMSSSDVQVYDRLLHNDMTDRSKNTLPIESSSSCSQSGHYDQSVSSQVSNDGSSRLHSYFLKKRFSDCSHDNYTFAQVFLSERTWCDRATPPTAAILQATTADTSSMEHTPSIDVYEKFIITEHGSFSDKDYDMLNGALKSHQQYREQLLVNMDSFKTQYDRSEEDVAEEEHILDRVKGAYRLAKKQREAKARKSEAAADANAHVVVEEEDVNFDDDDDQSLNMQLSNDEIELNEAYSDYVGNSDSGSDIESLRIAFIQIINQNITIELLQQGLAEVCTSTSAQLSMDDFKSLHQWIESRLPEYVSNLSLVSQDLLGCSISSCSLEASSASTAYSKLSATMNPRGSYWNEGELLRDARTAPGKPNQYAMKNGAVGTGRNAAKSMVKSVDM